MDFFISLYILYIIPLSTVELVQIILHFVTYYFIWIMVPYPIMNLLSFMMSHLLIDLCAYATSALFKKPSCANAFKTTPYFLFYQRSYIHLEPCFKNVYQFEFFCTQPSNFTSTIHWCFLFSSEYFWVRYGKSVFWRCVDLV